MKEPRTLLEEILEGEQLNDQEHEVLEWACRGLTRVQTAKEMNYSPETVHTYRKNAVAKLAARNLTHACVLAIGSGIVNVERILGEEE